MKPELAALINTALEQLVSQGVLAGLPDAALQIDRPKDPSLGDLSCNIAMVLAKRAGIAPRDLATQIIDTLPDNTLIERCDIAGPGFINFFVNASHHTGVVRTILESGSAYGKSNSGAGRQVQVEFVSANPTGPLHVGHGRPIGRRICRRRTGESRARTGGVLGAITNCLANIGKQGKDMESRKRHAESQTFQMP